MNRVYLEPGVYANIFKVNIPNQEGTIFTTSASVYPTLRDLRMRIEQAGWKARVYQGGDLIFAYGQDAYRLASQGFQRQKVYPYHYPKWCARLIAEGLSEHLKKKGYREWHGKGRLKLYEPEPYRVAAGGRLKIFRGYDLKAIYLHRWDQQIFGLVVDVSWEIQDEIGQRLTAKEIARNYNATVEIAQIQDELLPNNKINPEVARLRFQNHILPFITQNKEFYLPLDSMKASFDEMPLRVILGVQS